MVITRELLALAAEMARQNRDKERQAIPEGAMRVAPGSDAVVWRTNPDYSGEL